MVTATLLFRYIFVTKPVRIGSARLRINALLPLRQNISRRATGRATDEPTDQPSNRRDNPTTLSPPAGSRPSVVQLRQKFKLAPKVSAGDKIGQTGFVISRPATGRPSRRTDGSTITKPPRLYRFTVSLGADPLQSHHALRQRTKNRFECNHEHQSADFHVQGSSPDRHKRREEAQKSLHPSSIIYCPHRT